MSARVSITMLLVTACGNAPAPPPPTRATPTHVAPSAQGPIVATVNGEPIGLAEVESVARSTGLSPLEALRRLEQERVLLARVAAARAEDEDAEIENAVRRSAVQALLRDRVESPIDEASIDDAEIAARYAASRSAWARPERRTSIHVLAAPREPDDEAARAAAERFIQGSIARLLAARDASAEADAIGAEAPEGRSFTVRVEHLPPVDRHAAFDEPFLATLFALGSAPSVAPEPTLTAHGVHAIVLTRIDPAFEVTLAEATPLLRRQLAVEHRGAALDALTTDLAAHTRVAIDERLLATVFTGDLSLETASP